MGKVPCVPRELINLVAAKPWTYLCFRAAALPLDMCDVTGGACEAM